MTTSLLILSRFVHFGSGMILVGVVAFRWLILLPAFAGEPDTTWQAFMPLFLRLHQLFIGAGIGLVVSGLALFWAVSAGRHWGRFSSRLSSARCANGELVWLL
jgi:type III secretory pathway component EscT